MAILDYNHIPLTDSGSIVTVGMFDGVHLGHRHIVRTLLTEAAQRGLRPRVLTFDCHPRSVLGRSSDSHALLSDASERLQLLQSLGDLDVVVLPFSQSLASLSACEFLQQVLVQRIGAKAVLLGYDNMFGNRGKDDFSQMPVLAQRLGVAVLHDSPVLFDGVAVSSSRIRKAVSAGDMPLASHLLGYCYTLRGKVVEGRQVGRTLGYPTANVSLSGQGRLIPPEGVYAVTVRRQGHTQSWQGMANLGGQPTFGIDAPTFEVHLLDFEGSLYGEVLEVAFEWRLRDIRHFDDSEALRRQLDEDRAAVRNGFVPIN